MFWAENKYGGTKTWYRIRSKGGENLDDAMLL